MACVGCPFKTKSIGTRGPKDAPIVIVGESPGVQELRQGKPFVGPVGKVLWSAIPQELQESFYITNAIACFPKNKDVSKLGQAAKACNERLVRQLQLAPRKLIIALGNAALWSLTGNYNLKITQERGILHPSELAEYGILPVVHPAALLHGTGSYRQFQEDIEYACQLANGGKIKQPVDPTFHTVGSDISVEASIEYLTKFPVNASDCETTGFNWRHDRILCLGIAGDPENVFIFPEEVLKHPKVKAHLEGPTRFIWHNGKFDIKFLRQIEIQARVDEDTMLLSYCLDETGGIHDLETVSRDVLGASDYKYMVNPYAPKKTDSYENVPKPILYKYLALDVSNTLQVWNIYSKRVHSDPHLSKLYTQLLIPASETLARVETYGFMMDHKALEENAIRLNEQIERTKKIVQEIAGEPINPASPPQVAALLFDKLKLPTKRGRSTAKEVLDKLPRHPAVIALQEYRKAAKAFSTYITGFEKQIDTDNRVHTTFKIHGTRTGRLSSADPNIQNIPRDPLLRGMFVAPKGRRLVEIDLNQAELRSLAALSKDPGLLAIYNDPTHPGLHHEVSVTLFGAQYTSEQKMRAKAVNFGIVYGREGPSLAEEFEIPVSEGWRWISGWFKRFPKAAEFIQNCRKAPLSNSTLVTCFGRKKRHLLVTNDTLKGMQNEAANFPHQSIASDITLESAIRVQPRLLELDSHIVNLVHDSHIIETPDDDLIVAQVIKEVSEVMMQVPVDRGITAVPFSVEAKHGYRWGHLEVVTWQELLNSKNTQGNIGESLVSGMVG